MIYLLNVKYVIVFQVNFGVGTTATGFQLKSPYHIDSSTDEIFTLSAIHGTPVYGTAIVENFAGLTSVFRFRKILVDHTPPVFGNILTNLIMINTTDTNETNVQLEVEWSVKDDESGISLCYVSVGKLFVVETKSFYEKPCELHP